MLTSAVALIKLHFTRLHQCCSTLKSNTKAYTKKGD